MAELKTTATDANVIDFIGGVDPARQADCEALIAMMQKVTKSPPKMWGGSIVGFGTYHYKYESGHESDASLVGFSPRKQHLVIYIGPGFTSYADLTAALGKHKTGQSCLYIKSLADIDIKVLEKLVAASVKYMREKYPA